MRATVKNLYCDKSSTRHSKKSRQVKFQIGQSSFKFGSSEIFLGRLDDLDGGKAKKKFLKEECSLNIEVKMSWMKYNLAIDVNVK